MAINKFLGKHFLLFIILFMANLLFSKQKYYPYDMQISTSNDILEIFYIKFDGICQEWIPSLFSPILLADKDKIDKLSDNPLIEEVEIKIPTFSFEKSFVSYIYNYDFLPEKFNVTLGIPKSSTLVPKCYFGLSSNLGYSPQLKEEYIILNKLKNSNKINKIFSFDKWTLYDNQKLLKSTLYYGDTHDNFKSKRNDAIIGTCKTNKLNLFWGCQFNQMSFNGKVTDLKNSTGNIYQIYFSSEDYNIIFPKSFKNQFEEITNKQCKYNEDIMTPDNSYVYCDNIFNEKNYTILNLINDDINITIQLDNVNRYTNGKAENNRTRIKYKDINYFILPLIMFKQFHVQFDANKELISFYTTDKSILKNRKEGNKKDSGNTGLTIFLVIFIIILILALLYLVFWFIKKRRNSIEKNINKYNKFDEDDNFQNMNEKRVF